jgi:hemolysin-activating ACP:hemolysin acyltransferase
MTSQPGNEKYLLADWLDFHDLSYWETASILAMEPDIAEPCERLESIDIDRPTGISFQSAWQLASDALLQSFSFLNTQISEVEKNCVVELGRGIRPNTIDHGSHQFPEVRLDYQERIPDFINVAHEFSHALQLFVRKNVLIPPSVREVAAFLGEMALLEHLTTLSHPASELVGNEWHHQNKKYLGSDLRALNDDLRRPHALYNYRQNYPPARILAYFLFRSVNREKLRAVFEGKWSLKDCLRAVLASTKEQNMKNYLPEIPEKEADLPAVEAYRSLGMMTCLDLDYWKGQSEKLIKDYYAGLLKHMQNQTSYVVIGEENKPIGYATWCEDPHNPDAIKITRQAAPFGDHLQLQKSLRARLPNARAASVIYDRSARKEQVAW